MAELTPHLTEDQLQAHLDGLLDPRLDNQVQSHLAECKSCRRSLEQLENISYRLERLPALELSRDLSSLVVSRLQEEGSLDPAVTWTLVMETLGVAAVLAAFIPILQSAVWRPQLLNIGQELQAGFQIFLTQLTSSWLVWWADLQLQIRVLGLNMLPRGSLSGLGFSPWILIGAAGGLGIFINYLLLGRQPLPDRNHQAQ